MPTPLAKSLKAKVLKVDEELGLVFGFAIVSEIDGEPYEDLQGDYIPSAAMLKASTEFMQRSRKADDRHDEVQQGEIVHSMPMTPEIAKAFDIETKQTGWMVGMRPSPEIFKLYKSGEREGFSIGGEVLE